MGRFLLVVLLLAVAGYFAYTHFHKPLSDEELAVRDLEKRFEKAARAFAGSGRMSGMTGVDMTAGAEQAVRAVKQVRDELAGLKRGLSEEKARERADALQKKIEEFSRTNELDE